MATPASGTCDIGQHLRSGQAPVKGSIEQADQRFERQDPGKTGKRARQRQRRAAVYQHGVAAPEQQALDVKRLLHGPARGTSYGDVVVLGVARPGRGVVVVNEREAEQPDRRATRRPGSSRAAASEHRRPPAHDR
jgi:hypothetical protein